MKERLGWIGVIMSTGAFAILGMLAGARSFTDWFEQYNNKNKESK